MQKVLASFAVAALVASTAAQSPLTTLFASNNSGSAGGAVYFDLTLTVAVTITDINFNNIGGGAGTLDVYTVLGGRAGNMSSQALWTGPGVLGSPVTINANNTPSLCTLSSPLTLPVGTHGVALVANGFQHAYTNGTGANQTYNTLEMQFDGGNADNVPWGGGAFSPRVANVEILYSAGSPGTVFSTRTNYGAGCINQPDTFYEVFSPGTFDLIAPAPDNMTLLSTGSSYVALSGIATWVTPTAAATVLTLGDDADVAVTLSGPMPIFSGSTNALTVCSNGFVSSGAGNGVSFSPSASAFRDFPDTCWSSWHDYNPSAGGTVTSEEIAGVHYITWNQVPSFGQTVGEDLQFQFDLATGNVSIVWQAISNLGNGHVVGFSMGGVSANANTPDLSVDLPGSIPNIAFETEITPIQLDADARPIQNTVINLVTSNLSASTILVGTLVGTNHFVPPLDLGPFGMPGCLQYTDQIFVVLSFPGGASSTSVPLSIPGQLNLFIHCQSAAYDPASMLTPLGATVSNATELMVGDW